jgi:chromatin remodeling complex protein RSC6
MGKTNKQMTTQPATTATTEPAKTKKSKATKMPKEKEVVVEVSSTPAPTPSAKKTSKKVKTEPVASADEPVSTESAGEATSEPSVVTGISGDYSEFMIKLQKVSALLSMLKTEFRVLEKKTSRELRTAAKACAKRKRKSGNRAPSGFVKPTLISDELASFLGRQSGAEMARTEVTREINEYIRTHKLQHPENGRRIQADDKLMTLLKLTPTDELTYFNLQRYMSPHFAKSAPAVAAAAAASEVSA